MPCRRKPTKNPFSKQGAWEPWSPEGRTPLRVFSNVTIGGILLQMNLTSEGEFGGQKSINLSFHSSDGKSASAVSTPGTGLPTSLEASVLNFPDLGCSVRTQPHPPNPTPNPGWRTCLMHRQEAGKGLLLILGSWLAFGIIWSVLFLQRIPD